MQPDIQECECKTCENKSTLETQWDLIAGYFRDKGFVRSQINSYNELIYKYIPEVIERCGTFSFTIDNIKHTYTLRDPLFTVPCYREFEGQLTYVTPHYCRLRDLTYQSHLYCKLEVEIANPITETVKKTYEKILIAQIPVMVKSELCPLKNASEHKLAELGECMYEHGGYFIVNGSEKVIIGQEHMAMNQIFCYHNAKTGNYTADIRCIPEGISRAASQVVVRYAVDHKTSKHFHTATLQVSIAYMKNEIPLVILFRALGITNDDDIIQFITPSRDKRVIALLQPSFDEACIIGDQLTAIQYMSQNIKNILPSVDEQMERVKYLLLKEFFPQVGTDSASLRQKAFHLGHAVSKCLLTYLGEMDVDDRDHFGNKRINLAGQLIGALFRISFSRVMKEFRKKIEKSKMLNPKTDFEFFNITKQIRNSISTGNWGTNSSKQTPGVTQVLQRITYMSTVSHMRRIIAPIAKEGKCAKPRQLHNSSIFLTCPSDTPESIQVGLIKNMSMLMEVSVESSGASIRDMLHRYGDLQPHMEAIDGKTKVFVNGVCHGCTDKAVELFLKIKEWKMTGYIPFDCGIIFNEYQRELNVVTDCGRAIRPVLYVYGKKPDTFLHQLKEAIANGKTWKEICGMGLVEYLDSKEEENILCAMTVEDFVENPLGYQYTHMEIHPAMILGACASTIPYSNHTQAPRVSYQSSQMKQALGVYALNYSRRYDAQSHVMWYPQKPVVSTRMGKMLKIDEMPAGTNAIVAIMCYTGSNQEDSLLVNKSSLERGMFRSTYFKSWKNNEAKHGSNFEEFCVPPDAKVQLQSNASGITGGNRYDLLDEEDGLVGVNLRVSDHDVLIGKTIPITNTTETIGPNGITIPRGKVTRKDVSIALEATEEGTVDSVLLAQNEQGKRMAKVRLRQTRYLQVGDKLASNCAQKGVIGAIIPQEDMPFTADGMCPDICINTHCMKISS